MSYKENNGFEIGQTYILKSNLSGSGESNTACLLKKEDIVYLVDAIQDRSGCVDLSFIQSEHGLVRISTYSSSDFYFRVLNDEES